MNAKIYNETVDQDTGELLFREISTTRNGLYYYIKDKLKQRYGPKKPLRAFHAKTIGLVEAKFTVDDNLDEDLKVGLFKETKTFNAWIRFTNSDPKITKDKDKTVRGMAIKVLNVNSKQYLDKDRVGNTQDIILINSNFFFPGIVSMQFDGVKSVQEETFLRKLPSLFRLGKKSFRLAVAFINTRIITPNILEEMYFSGTPYAFGEKAIKWHVRPHKTITTLMPENPEDNFLTKQLIHDLSDEYKGEVAFALFVQFQEDKVTEPIEDTTVIWKTPYRRVATITIPKQNLDSPQRKLKDLNMSFSPGHAIIEHAPLGSINWIRRKVYKKLADERISPKTSRNANPGGCPFH
jgi:hypothetical protein